MRPAERGPWRKALRRLLRGERRHARLVRTTVGRARQLEQKRAVLHARALAACEEQQRREGEA